MPTNNKMGSIRLLFLLLLSCAVCLQAQTPTNFNVQVSGNIPDNGNVLTISPVILEKGYPGPTQFTLTAGYSTYICVNPYAAVAFNLTENCPNSNLLNFTYNPPTPDPFELFLNDYSFSFRGRSNLILSAKDTNSPWSSVSQNLTLYQNIPYYVSLQYAQILDLNSTESAYSLNISTFYAKCQSNQIPTNDNKCSQNISASITSHSQANITVSAGQPQLFQLQIGNLVPSFNLTFSTTKTVENLILYISYDQYPTKDNSQYMFNTASKTTPNGFIREVSHQNTITFTASTPLPGSYYVWMETINPEPREFVVNLQENGCNISETATDNQECGDITYSVISGRTMTQNFENNTLTYFAVPEATSLQLGVIAATSTNPFQALLGYNFFPVITESTEQYLNVGLMNQFNSTSGQLFLSRNVTNGGNVTFIFALHGTAGVGYTIWEGSACPYNCNGHGNCNLDLTCSCDDDYSGQYCNDHKKLSTLYIVLIIIGSAIVLAVLIGVPVALYLNNRKRARYERV